MTPKEIAKKIAHDYLLSEDDKEALKLDIERALRKFGHESWKKGMENAERIINEVNESFKTEA